MIKDLIDNDLVSFATDVETWEEAVNASCLKLLEHDYIEQSYVDEIVQCIKDNGPYIVLIPGIAMPHATPGAKGVHKTGMSLTVLDKPVEFDEEKSARLFFTICTNDPEAHLLNIQKLMELLMDESKLALLLEVQTMNDLKNI